MVAFRGSEPDDPSDLFTDADFRKISWTHEGKLLGEVHQGFAEELQDANGILAKVIAAVKSAGNRPLLLTGHSLGAALAVLAASRILVPRSIYTFGCPKVGNDKFAKAVATGSSGIVDHYRYIDCCDIVTRVPPARFGYEHAGSPRYIDRAGHIHDAPSQSFMEEDRRQGTIWYWQEKALILGNVFDRSLADHAPNNYLSAVLGLR